MRVGQESIIWLVFINQICSKEYPRPGFGVDPDFDCFSLARIEKKNNAHRHQDNHYDDDTRYQQWGHGSIAEIMQVTV